MKKSFFFTPVLLLMVFIFHPENSEAQLWKKIKNEVKNRAENNVVNKAGNATDKAIDNTADAVKGGKQANGSANADNNQAANSSTDGSKPATPSFASYKSHDFVAGDKIIFEPDMSNEPDAELPARFRLNKGNAEIQTYEGEKILHLQPDGGASVSPLMSNDHYLPEQFTLEFDMMFENPDGNYFRYSSDFNVFFRNRGDQNFTNGGLYAFTLVNTSQVKFGNTGVQSLPKELATSVSAPDSWHHIAIYVRKNIGKVYIDQYRVSASNTLPAGANKIDIKADRYGIKIKNVRLAEGGDDKYNKIVTDGKFIIHGILFDVNKSSIKPESMGALNEIVKMMKEHNDLKFEIDGHTDSDGKADANLKLSQGRADAVKTKLTEMGIDDARLTTKGFGATKPIDKNDNAEGKANNRRVEFVRK